MSFPKAADSQKISLGLIRNIVTLGPQILQCHMQLQIHTTLAILFTTGGMWQRQQVGPSNRKREEKKMYLQNDEVSSGTATGRMRVRKLTTCVIQLSTACHWCCQDSLLTGRERKLSER